MVDVVRTTEKIVDYSKEYNDYTEFDIFNIYYIVIPDVCP